MNILNLYVQVLEEWRGWFSAYRWLVGFNRGKGWSKGLEMMTVKVTVIVGINTFNASLA